MHTRLFYFLLISLFLTNCNGKSKSIERLTTVVMMTNLIKDSSVYKLYDSLHSKNSIWPAVKIANKKSGIQEIEIYRYEDKVVMMYSYPSDANIAEMDSLYISSDPNIKVWGNLMSSLQRSLPGLDTSKKWVTMKLIHHYKDGDYLK